MFLPIYATNREAAKGTTPAKGKRSSTPSSGPSRGSTADLLALASMPRV